VEFIAPFGGEGQGMAVFPPLARIYSGYKVASSNIESRRSFR